MVLSEAGWLPLVAARTRVDIARLSVLHPFPPRSVIPRCFDSRKRQTKTETARTRATTLWHRGNYSTRRESSASYHLRVLFHPFLRILTTTAEPRSDVDRGNPRLSSFIKRQRAYATMKFVLFNLNSNKLRDCTAKLRRDEPTLPALPLFLPCADNVWIIVARGTSATVSNKRHRTERTNCRAFDTFRRFIDSMIDSLSKSVATTRSPGPVDARTKTTRAESNVPISNKQRHSPFEARCVGLMRKFAK